jgi:hypothetical protein
MTPSAPSSAHEKREFATELKFLVDPAKAEEVRTWARETLIADPHASGPHGDLYQISSLYFDTSDFAVFQRRGWLRHSKFRIRRYNGAVVFFERKLKVGGQVSKRRSAISLPQFAQVHELPAEAAWFRRRTDGRQLRAVCQIDYQRTARVLLTPSGPIRLTLDEGICAARLADVGFHDRIGGAPLTDRVVLELKFRRDLPLMFRELVARFGLNPQPFSKYRTAIRALGLAPGVVVPAAAHPAPAAEKTIACQTS